MYKNRKIIKNKKFKQTIYNRFCCSNNLFNNKHFNAIDDIIWVFYILSKVFKGNLPWIKINDDGKWISHMTIKKIRDNSSPVKLCEGFPLEFVEIFKKFLSLSSNEPPNYDEIINDFGKVKLECDSVGGKKKINSNSWKCLNYI